MVTQGYNSMDRRSLAQEIIDRHRGLVPDRFISLRWWASNMTDANRRSVFANLEDTASGLRATRTDSASDGTLVGGTVFLSEHLLRAILHLNDRFGSFALNSIVGGRHYSNTSRHYQGIAVDIQRGSGVEGIAESPADILAYLEGRGFVTQRTTTGVTQSNYVGNASVVHVEAWGS